MKELTYHIESQRSGESLPNLVQLTGGESNFDIDARNVRKLLDELGQRFPALAPHLEEGIAVAIDGEIFQDAWFAKIEPDYRCAPTCR